MKAIRLGDLLVQNGTLTPAQRDEVLEIQSRRGGPFGAIAEEMFGVHPGTVEQAWAEQYTLIAPSVDPRTYNVNPKAVECISRRQAWQFRLLPIGFQRDTLVVCTTQSHLVRALKFAGWRLGHSCQFVISDAGALGEAMMTHCPMAGMTPEVVSGGGIAV